MIEVLKWFVPWEPSVAVMAAIFAMAGLFIRGSAVQPMEMRRRIYFWIGLASAWLSWQTQMDYYAEHEFFMERIQHSFLHHFGPFMIALARPWVVLRMGMPVRFKEWATAIFAGRFAAIALNPVMLVIVFFAVILGWLIPPVYFVAMLDWRVERLMQWSMVVNGLMFWGVALDRNARCSFAARILMMLAVIPPQILAGALLSLSPVGFYTVYEVCGRAFAGLDAVADQQIGGVILWIHGAMMSIIGVVIVARERLGTSTKL